MKTLRNICLLAILILVLSFGLSEAYSDTDHDGINDEYELLLANAYSPYLIYDEEEDHCIENPSAVVGHPWQVSPVSEFTGGGRSGIMITYVILHPVDCGFFGVGLDLYVPKKGQNEHYGDSEAISMFFDKGESRVTKLMIHRHGDWHLYDYTAFSWKKYSGGYNTTHPVVYVSESKHAMFPNDCDDGWTWVSMYEDCDGGQRVTLSISNSLNVGERAPDDQNFNRLGDSRSLNVSRYANERVWDNVQFCGGYAGKTNCAGSINSKLWPLINTKDRRKIMAFIFPPQSYHGWKK